MTTKNQIFMASMLIWYVLAHIDDDSLFVRFGGQWNLNLLSL